MSIRPLSIDRLRRRADLSAFDFGTTAEVADISGPIGQTRALDALRFGAAIERPGFNMFVMGPRGCGKHRAIEAELRRIARGAVPPVDWAYVQNFENPRKPRALAMAAGAGRKLRDGLDALLDDLEREIPAVFDSADYAARREDIDGRIERLYGEALSRFEAEAARLGVAIVRGADGITLRPVIDGEPADGARVARLDADERAEVQARLRRAEALYREIFAELPRWRREHAEAVGALDGEMVRGTVEARVGALKQAFRGHEPIVKFLDDAGADLIAHAEVFRGESEDDEGPGIDQVRARYALNLIVDHADAEGAPVVVEQLPSLSHLTGRIEHLSLLGSLMTDFTMIKPGALHRANGGYLLIDAIEVLQEPLAWEALKRALRSGELKIERAAEHFAMTETVSIDPEPLPLDVKIVLFGERWLYYALCDQDPEFLDLFKVQVDFSAVADRTAETETALVRLGATIARQEGLLPLERSGAGRLIEHASRLAEDAERLLIMPTPIADLLREADHLARVAGAPAIAGTHLRRAEAQQRGRADRYAEEIEKQMMRDLMMIDTEGSAVGQVNGLVIRDLGEFSFGHPARITARARPGEGEIVDIERMVDLGGPTHSKGVLILSSYLAATYSSRLPLSLAASVGLEQSYGGIDGDSASAGELIAILSAIAEVPVKQSIAITGSMDQHGRIQPIGGVNQKIEGFFDLCAKRGFKARHGVVIPKANVAHLMLRDEVLDAVSEGRFFVWPVETVDEAAEILTGMSAGRKRRDGSFAGGLNRKVAERLAAFAKLRVARSRRRGWFL